MINIDEHFDKGTEGYLMASQALDQINTARNAGMKEQADQLESGFEQSIVNLRKSGGVDASGFNAYRQQAANLMKQTVDVAKERKSAASISSINSLYETSTKSGTKVNPELLSSIINLAQSDPEEARKIAKESFPVAPLLSVSDKIALEKRGEEKVAREQLKEAVTAKSERMVSLMNELKDSEGFDSLFGFGYTGIPGSSGADAKVLYDQIQAQGFMEAIKDMRGMGALSNAEGEKASAAFTGISPSMSEKAAKQRINEVIKYIKTGEDRLKTGKLIETPKNTSSSFSEANSYFNQATQ